MTGAPVPPAVRLTAAKFDASGKARPFPGNTIMWHLPPDSLAHRALVEAQACVARSVPAGRLALLPPTSFHVTLFEGCLDHVRTPQAWPRSLPLNAPLSEVHAFMVARLRTFDLGCEPPFHFEFGEPEACPQAVRFTMRPRDWEQADKLLGVRERIAGALGLWHEDHGDYELHVTVAYVVQPLAPSERTAFEAAYREAAHALRAQALAVAFGAPEFCFFEDMTHFRTDLYLARRKHRKHSSEGAA